MRGLACIAMWAESSGWWLYHRSAMVYGQFAGQDVSIRRNVADEAGSFSGADPRTVRARCLRGRQLRAEERAELLSRSRAARRPARRRHRRFDDLRLSRQQWAAGGCARSRAHAGGPRAAVMAPRDKLAHGAAKPFVVRLKASGYDAKTAAENISAGYHTLAEAFSGWRDSPPHRANMLLKGATRIGIAAVYTPTSKYKVYWALILAEPEDGKG